MATCPGCGSQAMVLVFKSEDPQRKHYATRLCLICRRNCGFEPWPRGELCPTTVAALVAQAPPLTVPPGPLPPLTGSPKQIAYARSVRPVLMRRWAPGLSADLKRLVRTIADSGWWLMNKDADVEQIKWPVAWYERREAGVRDRPNR